MTISPVAPGYSGSIVCGEVPSATLTRSDGIIIPSRDDGSDEQKILSHLKGYVFSLAIEGEQFSSPKFAKKIGVVTSETGAVIRDIINVTKSKNPYR